MRHLEKQLTTYQKSKIVIQIINDLIEIPNKDMMYIHTGRGEHQNEFWEKISKRTKIQISNYGRECGMVEISEFFQLTFDEIEDRMVKKLNNWKPSPYPRSSMNLPDFNVGDELKERTKQFEEKAIPSSGPCETLIGELFRAMQRIEYRAGNDGDLWYVIGSPSFMSYIFLLSEIDKLNWSSSSYNEENGQHEFVFTNPFLKENSWDGKISTVIEGSLAHDAEFIKYQLMDLLDNGKIKDVPNDFDSRDYSSLVKDKYSRY